MPDISAIDPDLVAFQDAVKEFKVSLGFLYNHSYGDGETSSEERPLRRITIPGDRRTFLRRSAILAYLRPSDVKG